MNATQKTNSISVVFQKSDEVVDEMKQFDPISTIKNEVFAEFKPALSANKQLLRLALVEAEGLARQTEFPQLFFPLLAIEKAQEAARWQSRQWELLRASSPYALAA